MKAGPAELRIASAGLVGTQRLTPGGTASIRVEIENTGSTSAQVTAAFAPKRAQVIRGNLVTIAPRSRAAVTLNVPIDVRSVVRERFPAYLFIADPATAETGNALAQLWRDGDLGDNQTTLDLEVPVTNYDVTITMSQINVENDCNPGPGKSNWGGSFRAGSVAAAEAPRFNDYSILPSFRSANGHPWFGASSDTRVAVSSGDRVQTNLVTKLLSVDKTRHLAILTRGHIHNGILPDQKGELPRVVTTIPPQDWNAGGTRQYTANFVQGPFLLSHKNCGPNTYSITLVIQTTPTLLQ
ncbi:MAG TPA: hypothetical protein VM580_05685 [Labilithrix sp.]|nr:hypothetical protein [Labilithrix sp.]